jgi:rubrerythrin
MKEMTQQHLINAFGGESQAHMRYLHFANQADKEKMPNIARLFRAIAFAEYVHAGDHYACLKHLNGGAVAEAGATFGPGNTVKNLGLALMGERFEVAEMYPVYMAVASMQGEKAAEKTFTWAYKTEQQHVKLYERAEKAAKKKKDVRLSTVQVCKVCGCTVEGDAPAECPTCKAKKVAFVAFGK